MLSQEGGLGPAQAYMPFNHGLYDRKQVDDFESSP